MKKIFSMISEMNQNKMRRWILCSAVIAAVAFILIILFVFGVFAGRAESYIIELDKTECEVDAGYPVCVKAKLVPENSLVDIYFTSSNENVLTVDGGGIAQTHSGGVAAIEANADIGGKTVTAVCTVVVHKQTAETVLSEMSDFPAGADCPAIPEPVIDADGFLASDNLANYKLYNADVVAWLYVPGTNINLPVAQSALTDPEFYLSRGLNKYFKYSGSAFLDAKSSVKDAGKITDQQTVVYGHARGTDIFDQLEHRTILQSWYNNKNNRYIYLNTTLEKTVWEVFACYYTDTSDSAVAEGLSTMNYLYTTEQLFEKFSVEEIGAASVRGTLPELMKDYDRAMQTANSWRDRILYSRRYASFAWLGDRTYDGAMVQSGEKVLTLVSCADFNSGVRYVVHAKQVKQQSAV